jgi:hypothetical protein
LGQEFIIKSQQIEDKINQLLPSQGGFAPGVDFSASTTVIPIVDLTETAEGSNLRQDLQTALSLDSISAFNVVNTTTTLVNTPGYYRIFGMFTGKNATSAVESADLKLTDGISSKTIVTFRLRQLGSEINNLNAFDFIVFLEAGESITATSTDANVFVSGNTRQVADLQGNLVNP